MNIIIKLLFSTLLTVTLTAPTLHAREIPIPEVPDSIQDSFARADYLLLHFWDNVTSPDVTANNSSYMEQAFAKYIGIFSQATPLGRTKAIKRMVEHGKSVYLFNDVIADLADIYLWDLQSPTHDLELYLLFAKEISQLKLIDNTDQLRRKERVKFLEQNRPGTKAINFSMETPDGKHVQLDDFVGINKTLLFYNPECNSCQSVLAELNTSTTPIIAVCIETEHSNWYKCINNLPTTWHHGYIPADYNSDLYDHYYLDYLPAILYLDSSNTVIKRSWIHL